MLRNLRIFLTSKRFVEESTAAFVLVVQEPEYGQFDEISFIVEEELQVNSIDEKLLESSTIRAIHHSMVEQWSLLANNALQPDN